MGRSRLAVTGASLEDRFVHEQFGEMSLRWVYNHMIADTCATSATLISCANGSTGVSANRSVALSDEQASPVRVTLVD